MVDVCSHRSVFEAFRREWIGRRDFAMAVACCKALPAEDEGGVGGIGERVTRRGRRRRCPVQDRQDDADLDRRELESLTVREEGAAVVGIAVSWEQGGGDDNVEEAESATSHVAYYLPLVSNPGLVKGAKEL